MKLAILKRYVEMLLESIITNLSVPNKKIKSTVPFQKYGLLGWFSIYRIGEDFRTCEWHMSMFILLTPLPLGIGMFSIPIALLQEVLSSISGLV